MCVIDLSDEHGKHNCHVDKENPHYAESFGKTKVFGVYIRNPQSQGENADQDSCYRTVQARAAIQEFIKSWGQFKHNFPRQGRRLHNTFWTLPNAIAADTVTIARNNGKRNGSIATGTTNISIVMRMDKFIVLLAQWFSTGDV